LIIGFSQKVFCSLIAKFLPGFYFKYRPLYKSAPKICIMLLALLNLFFEFIP